MFTKFRAAIRVNNSLQWLRRPEDARACCFLASQLTIVSLDIYIYIYMCISRLTVVSRKAKKKQHAHASSSLRDHYSELFTRMAALKF